MSVLIECEAQIKCVDDVLLQFFIASDPSTTRISHHAGRPAAMDDELESQVDTSGGDSLALFVLTAVPALKMRLDPVLLRYDSGTLISARIVGVVDGERIVR